MGNIASKILYRSAHPICNGRQVNEIITSVQNAEITTIINLGDSVDLLKGKLINCPWYKNLFESDRVIALNINRNFNISEKRFTRKLKAGLLFIIDHEGPYLIHCEAGADRTGFLAMLLEAFMGASLEAIVKDYMLSFVDGNAYSETHYKQGAGFVLNTFSEMNSALPDADEGLQKMAVKYLAETIGLCYGEMKVLGERLGGRRI